MESLAGCLWLLLWSSSISYLLCCCCHFFIHFNLCAYVCAQLLAHFLSQFNHLGIQTAITKSKPSQSTPSFSVLLKAVPVYTAYHAICSSRLVFARVFSQRFFFWGFVRRCVEFHSTTSVIDRGLFTQCAQQPHTNSKSIREQSERGAKSPYLYKTRAQVCFKIEAH